MVRQFAAFHADAASKSAKLSGAGITGNGASLCTDCACRPPLALCQIPLILFDLT
jgi:hypothetical protein